MKKNRTIHGEPTNYSEPANCDSPIPPARPSFTHSAAKNGETIQASERIMPIDLPSKSRAVVITLRAAPLALLINARKLFGSRSPYRMLRLSLYTHCKNISTLWFINSKFVSLRDPLASHTFNILDFFSNKYIKIKTQNWRNERNAELSRYLTK